jgi:hypothetical protein
MKYLIKPIICIHFHLYLINQTLLFININSILYHTYMHSMNFSFNASKFDDLMTWVCALRCSTHTHILLKIVFSSTSKYGINENMNACQDSDLAQMLARWFLNCKVVGSIPRLFFFFFLIYIGRLA